MKDARAYAIELKDKMTDLISSIEEGNLVSAREVLDECEYIISDCQSALNVEEEEE